MLVIGDVPVFGDPVDPEALTQIQRCRSTADAAALMADHHIGYAVPIGGVVVYKGRDLAVRRGLRHRLR